MISVVLTSCGRLELLKITLDSFNKFNKYPITEFIIIDDSGNKDIHNELKNVYPDYKLILNPENRGVTACIDDAYNHVKTPYIFHCEDDWEFTKSGFIEKSIDIIKSKPTVMQVWLRGINNPNSHPIEKESFFIGDVEYKYVSVNFGGVWHGFTFNPSVRRLKDYLRVAPYCGIRYDGYTGNANPVFENYIGRRYYEMGFRAVTLIDEYCVHIGAGKKAIAG